MFTLPEYRTANTHVCRADGNSFLQVATHPRRQEYCLRETPEN